MPVNDRFLKQHPTIEEGKDNGNFNDQRKSRRGFFHIYHLLTYSDAFTDYEGQRPTLQISRAPRPHDRTGPRARRLHLLVRRLAGNVDVSFPGSDSSSSSGTPSRGRF